MVAVCIEKSAVDGSVAQEPDPDANAVIAGNILNEFKTNVKGEKEEHKNPAISSLKALKFKSIGKPEKLFHVRKVSTITNHAIAIDMHHNQAAPLRGCQGARVY